MKTKKRGQRVLFECQDFEIYLTDTGRSVRIRGKDGRPLPFVDHQAKAIERGLNCHLPSSGKKKKKQRAIS